MVNPAMTKQRTAILWGPDDLFAQAMEILLKNAQGCELIKMPAGLCIGSMVEQVQAIKPDLLIFYQEKYGEEPDPLMSLLLERPELRALADLPQLKVIIVSLENNVMQVYSKHSVTIRKPSDLLAIIEDRYSPDHSVEKEVHTGKTRQTADTHSNDC